MTVLDSLRGAFRGKKRTPDLTRTIFREFAESLNLIEDFDQIALNLLGTIKEAVSVDRLAFFIHDPDLGQFRIGASIGYPPRTTGASSSPATAACPSGSRSTRPS